MFAPLTDLVSGFSTSSTSFGSLPFSQGNLGLETHCCSSNKFCNSIPSSEPLLLKLDFLCCFKQDLPEYSGRNSNKGPVSDDDEAGALSDCCDVLELGTESWDDLGGGNLKVIGIKVLLSIKERNIKTYY